MGAPRLQNPAMDPARVAALVRGSLILVRETSIAVRVISERAASVRAHARLQ